MPQLENYNLMSLYLCSSMNRIGRESFLGCITLGQSPMFRSKTEGRSFLRQKQISKAKKRYGDRVRTLILSFIIYLPYARGLLEAREAEVSLRYY